jgi:formylglycine-generating enzyme required for sulfatase activity
MPKPFTGRDEGEMVLIPAGEFQMGSPYLESKASQPVHTVYLDAFYIDTHEVTVGEYKQFLEAQGKQLSSIAKKHAPTDKHPIVAVSWYDAMAYAQWAGKRLPTEAEWEKAARGPEQFEHYPWEVKEIGSSQGEVKEIGSSQANYDGNWGETLPVGSFKPNGYGLYDIAGNVSEWCLDPFLNDFYDNSPKKNPFAGSQFKTLDKTIVDFKNVKGQRVVRGGSWKDKDMNLRVDARSKADIRRKVEEADGTQKDKNLVYPNVGFRCARDFQ